MEEGYLATILCGDGSKDIPVGQVFSPLICCNLGFSCEYAKWLHLKYQFHIQQAIAVIVDSEDEVAEFKDYKASSDAASKPPPPPTKKEETVKPSPPAAPPKADIPQAKPASPTPGARVFASPLARKIAEEKNVRLLLEIWRFI